MSIFNLPDLGEGLPDAEIREWHVKEGDEIRVDQPLVSMETAKAVVEVPSPQTGRIAKLFGQPGDVINTDSPLVEFSGAGEAIASKSTTDEAIRDTGTVAGQIEVGDTVIKESATGIAPTTGSTQQLKILPAVRALAKRLNVNLQQVTPSGAGGRITAEDVEKAAQQQTNTDTNMTPLRGVQRHMAQAMAQSHAQVVPVTLVDDAMIHDWAPGTDITFRVIRALVAGCKAEPNLNAHFDGNKLARHAMDEIHIGLAMDSGEGLFVPVLKNAQQTSATDLRSQINRFKEQVKARDIPASDLQGATITLSNFGNMAGRYANPIITPPQVAILGTGKIRDEVVAIDGQAAVRRVMPLSLSMDHRAVTGGEACRFLAAVIADLALSE